MNLMVSKAVMLLYNYDGINWNKSASFDGKVNADENGYAYLYLMMVRFLLLEHLLVMLILKYWAS